MPRKIRSSNFHAGGDKVARFEKREYIPKWREISPREGKKSFDSDTVVDFGRVYRRRMITFYRRASTREIGMIPYALLTDLV